MRKTQIILFIVCLLLLLAAAACSTNEKQPSGQTESNNEKHILSYAKTDFYATGEEIEARAEVIIKATRTSKEDNACNLASDQQPPHYGYTTSMVQVEEIKKNTSGQPIKAGDELRILERQFSYLDGDTIVICHLNQYKMMEPGREYILYLYYSQTDDWYVMPGAMQGKIPVSQEEDLLFPASQATGDGDLPEPEENSQIYQAMKNIQKYTLEKWEIIRKCIESWD